jgi:hypothetical protein
MNATAPSARRLVTAVVVLVVVDLVGGLLAVASGVNTWGEAWGSSALLAAPLPMVVVQVVLCWAATRGERRSRVAVVASALLAVACLVSVVSGFFDGGLGNAELSGGLVAYQALLLTVTAVVGALAAARLGVLVRAGHASRASEGS